MAPLEKALSLREARGVADAERAETCFALARALWTGGGDRPRARRLALEAQRLYASLGSRHTGEVERTLAGWNLSPR